MENPTEIVVTSDTMSQRDEKLIRGTIAALGERPSPLSAACPGGITEDDLAWQLAEIAIEDNSNTPIEDYVKETNKTFLSLAYGELARIS